MSEGTFDNWKAKISALFTVTARSAGCCRSRRQHFMISLYAELTHERFSTMNVSDI